MTSEHTPLDASGHPVEAAPAPISGYRQLSADDIFRINLLKARGNEIMGMLRAMRKNTDTVYTPGVGTDHRFDHRWISIAETHIQQGFMAAVRAVARPEGV